MGKKGVQAKHCRMLSTNFWIQKVTQQCFAFIPKANFPAHNLNFHWRLRWWDQIQATYLFKNLYYFKIIFVTLTCFYLTKKFEEKNSFGCKRTDENFHFQRYTHVQLFSSATLFLEGSTVCWIFSFPKKFAKWKQVKVTNMIITRPVQKSLYLSVLTLLSWRGFFSNFVFFSQYQIISTSKVP